jgi:hypothetical protein
LGIPQSGFKPQSGIVKPITQYLPPYQNFEPYDDLKREFQGLAMVPGKFKDTRKTLERQIGFKLVKFPFP